MAAYKEPGFSQRRAAAAQAKEKALEKLKARVPIDPIVQAERLAAAQVRERAQSEKRAAIKAKKAEEKSEKADVAARLALRMAPNDAELKAARDAKYAARKARKK